MAEVIRRGADWLEHPDLQALLAEQGLDDVHVELVGFRKSFAGKAWPYAGYIRMVSEGVHPLRWLVTLLHELAHVADWRARRDVLQARLGRPLRRGDGREIWHMDRTHGRLWREQFSLLAEAAIARGLFVGNEQVVREHAASGATSSDHVMLDLTADPRVEADDLRLHEERARQVVAELKLREAEFREVFRPGNPVHFDAGPRRGVITGELLRINRQTCTVRSAGVDWHVPHNFLQVGPAPPDARPAMRPTTPRDRFTVGQQVTFRHGGTRYAGQIVRVNAKTCTVQTADHGQWRVTFSLLRPVPE